MAINFHERYVAGEVKPPSERSTGLVFAAVALIIAFLWRSDVALLRWALGIAGALSLVSLIAPVILRPLNILWFKLGLLLHRIANPVVMLAVFAVVFVPAGLIMRLWHDPLRLRRMPDAPSYWIDRQQLELPAGSMRNQF